MIVLEGVTYLSIQESSAELGIPISTLYRWCKAGQVRTLQNTEANIDSGCKYLINRTSLLQRHRRVYLEV